MAITHADWLTALAEVEDLTDTQEALTAKELASIWDCTWQKARDRAQALIRAGKASLTRKRVLRTDTNGLRSIVAYKLTAKPRRRSTRSLS